MTRALDRLFAPRARPRPQRDLLAGRVRIVDPDRIADESVSVTLRDGVLRFTDETTGLTLAFDPARAEAIGHALITGAALAREA